LRTHQPATRTAAASRAEPESARRNLLRRHPVRANRVLTAAHRAQGPVHQFAHLDIALPSNRTGLPDRLKAGIEHLSGFAMDDVRVHYNSAKPATVPALAYTKGNEIHVGPGQEQHLPHEAWHVVQQKQGRVKPTLQMKGVAIDDDPGFEIEADRLGSKAAAPAHFPPTRSEFSKTGFPHSPPAQFAKGKKERQQKKAQAEDDLKQKHASKAAEDAEYYRIARDPTGKVSDLIEQEEMDEKAKKTLLKQDVDHIKQGHARHAIAQKDIKHFPELRDKSAFPKEWSWEKIKTLIIKGIPSDPSGATPSPQPDKYGPCVNIKIVNKRDLRAIKKNNKVAMTAYIRVDFKKLEDTNGELVVATAFPIREDMKGKYGIPSDNNTASSVGNINAVSQSRSSTTTASL